MKRIILLLFAIILLLKSASWSSVDFDKLNGTDLGMGAGARAIGMGGAFVSVADDASAVCWNPAGLSLMNSSQLLLSGYLPGDFSAAVLAYRPMFPLLEKMKFAIAAGYINRLSFKGDSGSGTWEGAPSHLTDMAMIEIGEDFQGRINSKTYDSRLSFSLSNPGKNNFSIGAGIIRVC